MQTERRSSYRIALKEAGAFVENPASRKRAMLRVLNAAGGSIAASARDWADEARGRPMRFKLGSCPPFATDIALLGPASQPEGEGLLAFRFQGLNEEAAGALSAFLCEQHAAQDRQLPRLLASSDHTIQLDPTDANPARSVAGSPTILTLLRHYLIEHKASLFLYQELPAAPISLSAVALEVRSGRWRLLVSGPEHEIRELSDQGDYSFFYHSPLALSWFRAAATKTGAGDLLIAAPTVLFHSGFRASRRVAPAWDRPAEVTIEHPYGCGQRITGPVRDLAGNGYSMEFEPSLNPLFPGQPLAGVRLDLPLGSVEVDCVVRTCRPASEPGRFVAGFEVVGFRSPEEYDRWTRSLVPCIFPEIRVGDRAMVAAAWSRLQQSGYLDLIDEPERTRLRAPFFEEWTRHATDPGLRARFLVAYDGQEPVGLAAANLVYPKTYLLHSGGVDRDAQRSGRLLQLAGASFFFAHTLADYALTLFEANTPINVAVFQRFVQRYIPRQDNTFDAFTVYRWHASRQVRVPAVQSDRSLQVVSATDELLGTLWQHQRKTLSPLELAAYAWSPDNRPMREFSESCARNGYHRARDIFFALNDGVPIAALVAETGSDAMNVFSLLNSCSVVLLEEPYGRGPQLLRLLLARAIDFYAGANRRTFLFLGSPDLEHQAHLNELGFSYVATGWRWLAARRVMPAYLSYLEDLRILGASRRDSGHRRPPTAGLAQSEG